MASVLYLAFFALGLFGTCSGPLALGVLGILGMLGMWAYACPHCRWFAGVASRRASGSQTRLRASVDRPDSARS